MTQFALPLAHTRPVRLLRAHLYVVRMLAVGLVAIGISGAVCQAIGYSFGDHALAADAQVAQPSAERCAEYLEYAPAKPTCAAAEMAHHADEIVEYRLAAGVLGLLAAAAYAAFRWRASFSDDESRRQLRAYLRIATGAFGLGAAVLLGTAVGVLLAGGDAAPRWFADGSVAMACFAGHALWLRVATRPRFGS